MSDFLRGTKTRDMHTDVNFKLSKGINGVSSLKKILDPETTLKNSFMVKNQTKIPQWTGDKQGIACQWEKL